MVEAEIRSKKRHLEKEKQSNITKNNMKLTKSFKTAKRRRVRCVDKIEIFC